MSKARAEMLRMVQAADEPVTPTYVSEALGKTHNTVKKTMWEMSKAGQLSSDRGGKYTGVTGNPGNRGNRTTGVSADTDNPVLDDEPGKPLGTSERLRPSVTMVTAVTEAQRNRRLTGEEADRAKRLIDEGMAPTLAGLVVRREQGMDE